MRRNSRQKKAILAFLKDNKTHPSAEAIYEGVKKDIPNISIGTVYRNLKILQEDGEISEISSQGMGRFEENQGTHYHFRCVKCGQVIDIDEPVDEEINRRMAAKTGLIINSHQLEFHGLCKECQNKYTREERKYG